MREYSVKMYDYDDYERARHMPEDEVLRRLEAIGRGWLPDYSYLGKNEVAGEDKYEAFANQMALIRAAEIIKGKR